jgi:hypothetical protein
MADQPVTAIPHLLLNVRDDAASIVTGYELEDPGTGVRVPVGQRTFKSLYLFLVYKTSIFIKLLKLIKC